MSFALQPIRHLKREEMPTDAELVRRAIDGEKWAKEVIFRRFAADVFRYVRRLHSGDDVEDIVQETFVDVLLNLDTLRDPDALRGWVLGVAVRRVRRVQRRRGMFRRFFVSNGEGALESQASPICTPEQCAELALVDQALMKVDVDVRIAWVLRRIEGEKLVDITEIVGASLATVKRRITAGDRHVAKWRSHDS